MALSQGDRLGRYEILAPLGAGGMGEVYRAVDSELKREVAVKILPEAVADDPARLERFTREARAVATLSHPNILEIHDFGRDGDVTYAITELLEGDTLRDLMTGTPMPWRRAREIGAAVADGLAAAHDSDVVHRDLKPENIFVTEDDRVKILDFGLARFSGPTSTEDETGTLTPADTQKGVVIGTLGYMAPEQLRGDPADARSDIFSLGCVLYEMLSGRRAFLRDSAVDTMAAILKDDPPPLAHSGVVVGPELSKTIERCLEKRPQRRFQSAADLAFNLRAIVSDSGVSRADPQVVLASHGRRRWWVAAAAVLVVAAAFLAWWQLRPAGDVAVETNVSPEVEQIPWIDEWVIAVERFENRTGDPSLDPVGCTISERLADGLVRVNRGLESLPAVTVLAADTGTGFSSQGAGSPLDRQGELLITGSFAGTGADLALVARIRDADTGRVLYTAETAPVAKQLDAEAMEPLLQRIMGALGTHMWTGLDNVSHVPLHDVFREHVAGVEEGWSGNPRGFERIENAHHTDPEFLNPVSFLAAYRIINFQYDRAEPYLDHLRQRSDRLTRFESLYLAVLESWFEISPGSGLRAARELQELAPTCLTCRHLRARLAFALNRPGEVVETIVPTMEHIPRPFGWLRRRSQRSLRRAYDRLGEYQPLLELARQMRRESPGDTNAFTDEAVALVGLGRFEELEELVEECADFPGGECNLFYVLFRTSALLASRGEHERSLRYGERSVEVLRALPEEDLLERQFDYLNALRMAERWNEYADFARDTADRLEEDDSLHWYALTCVGMAATHGGDRQTAQAILDQLLTREDFAYSVYLAAYLGDLDAAVGYLKQSIEEEREFTYEHFVRWDPDLAPLWGYPPFEELVKPKG